MAPSYKQATALWDEEIVPRFQGLHGVEVHKSDRRVTIPGGGTLQIWSAETADSLRGRHFDGAIIEEASYQDGEYVWNSCVAPTLLDTDGWAIFASTPKLGSWFNDLCQKEIDGELGEDWEQFSWTTRDNTALPASAVETAYASYPPGSTDLQQELDAMLIKANGELFKLSDFRRYESATTEGVHSPLFVESCETLVDGGAYRPFAEVVLICDLAASLKQAADYTVVVAAGITSRVFGRRRAAVLEVKRVKLSGPDQISLVSEMAKTYKVSRVLVEAVAYQLTAVQHLERNMPGTRIVPIRPDADKRSRAIPLAAAMSRADILWPEDASYMAETIKEFVAFPTPKVHDDVVDAMSYLAKDLISPSATRGGTAGVTL